MPVKRRVPTPRPVIQCVTRICTSTAITTTNMASLLHEIEERTVPESLTLLDDGAGDPNRVVCAVWGCGLGFNSRALMTVWECDWPSAEGSRMREPKKGPSFRAE